MAAATNYAMQFSPISEVLEGAKIIFFNKYVNINEPIQCW